MAGFLLRLLDMPAGAQASSKSAPGDLLANALAPGALTVSFRPVVDLGPKAPLLYGVELVACGPCGSPLEDSLLLQACARERRVEAVLDRDTLRAALPAAAQVLEAPRFALPVHASTLAGDRRFTDALIEEARFWSLDPRRLIVEVVHPQDLGSPVREALGELRAAGFPIAIGGVGLRGTDHEGLLRCRPDFIKVERSSPHGSRGSCEDALIFDLLFRQSRAIGARPLATGVESLADLEDAVELGIQLVQGGFFGGPMNAAGLRDSGLLRGEIAPVRLERG